MDEELWTLRFRTHGQGPSGAGARTFSTEATFILALQAAYRDFATDLVATLPDGQVLMEAALRRRYPLRQES
jgi:hypothetical protein